MYTSPISSVAEKEGMPDSTQYTVAIMERGDFAVLQELTCELRCCLAARCAQGCSQQNCLARMISHLESLSPPITQITIDIYTNLISSELIQTLLLIKKRIHSIQSIILRVRSEMMEPLKDVLHVFRADDCFALESRTHDIFEHNAWRYDERQRLEMAYGKKKEKVIECSL